jgi:hypothetical protein
LDYTNSSCPKILLEPQRSNLNEAATNFAAASYFTSEATRTTGQADPAAGTDATRFLETTATDNHGFFYVFYNPPATGAVTQSIFVKDNGRGAVRFGSNGQTVSFVFTFATGAISNVIGGPSATSATQYANGWWRLSMTFIVTAGAPINHTFVYGWNGTATSYAGDTAKGFLAYGAQFEYGAYPTSLILTTGAAVTRLADECRKGTISSLIGQTEGTIFGEMYTNPIGTESLLTWTRNSSAGLYGNFIFLGSNGSAEARVQVVQAGSVQAEIVSGSALPVGWHKFALAYKANDFALYVDGVQVGTVSSGSVPTGMNEIYIDQYIDGGIRNASKKQLLLFKTRLTNAQLAELTTL